MPTSVEPHERFGDAIHIRLDDKPTQRAPDRADGPPRHRVPQGRGGAPAVPHRGRPRLRPRRGRHEGAGSSERLRAGGLQALRRRAGAARRPHHRRRGDRLAVLAPRDRAGRARRRAACSTPSPAVPAATSSPRARAACSSPSRSTGKAAHSGGNFEKGISAIGEMAHKIVAMHALTDLKRGITVNVGLVKGGQSVNTTAPHAEGQIDLRYVKPEQRAPALAALQKIVDTRHGPRHHARSSRSRASSCPSRPTPAAEELFGTLPGGRRRCRPAGRRRVLRRLRRFRLHRRRSAARRCAASGRSAPTRTRPRSTSRSTPWCRAPRPWRSPSCACRRPV